MQGIFNFLIENGVKISEIQALERLYLVILLIPIVATIIGIARYIIGIRSINFYATLFGTFILFDISTTADINTTYITGLKYGIIFFLCVFLTSTLSYKFLRKFRMHYIPKLSLIITAASVAMMVLIALLLLLDKTLPLSISPFVFIALIVTSEAFMSVYAKKNFRYTLTLALETLIITILAYTVISFSAVQTFVINNPWLIIILAIANLYIGRFIGLRLTEYWRFRTILLNSENLLDEQTKSNLKK